MLQCIYNDISISGFHRAIFGFGFTIVVAKGVTSQLFFFQAYIVNITKLAHQLQHSNM